MVEKKISTKIITNPIVQKIATVFSKAGKNIDNNIKIKATINNEDMMAIIIIMILFKVIPAFDDNPQPIKPQRPNNNAAEAKSTPIIHHKLAWNNEINKENANALATI